MRLSSLVPVLLSTSLVVASAQNSAPLQDSLAIRETIPLSVPPGVAHDGPSKRAAAAANTPTPGPGETLDTSGRIVSLKGSYKEHQKPGLGMPANVGVDPGNPVGAAAMITIIVMLSMGMWMISTREEESWDRRVYNE